MIRVFSYRLNVKHDKGTATFHVVARNRRAAMAIVMAFEKCPQRAITDCKRQ